jgi:squalene synthase HpnC
MRDAHYENFPVASVLLPRRLRRPVALIYNFARRADDFADEGDWPDATRLARLDGFRAQLDRIAAGQKPDEPLFHDLAAVIAAHALPLHYFYDLLSAFSQDVTKKRYANFGEVMDYCRRSANPVGALLLHLFGERDERKFAQSDAICSSLQIINFLQDVAVDWQKGRVYFPQDEMARYGIRDEHIARGDTGGAWRPFMATQIERAQRLLRAGAPLGKALPGRVGLEIRLIVAGGDRILQKLARSGGDVFDARPVLEPADWVFMLWKALRAR